MSRAAPSSSCAPSSCKGAEYGSLGDPLGNCESVHDFKKLNRIGEGTYGYVYRAVHRPTGKIYALKRIILHHEEQDGFPLTSIREVKTLMRSRHANIVQLHSVVVGQQRDAVFLLFEYCEHDLSQLIKHMKYPFKESEIKRLMLQLLSAVEYIHKNWIVHRDIKLSNLLYNNRGQLKLADFGLARTIACSTRRRDSSSVSPDDENNLTQLVVTLWYRAPELLFGSAVYSFPIDIWSVGCIFGELLLQSPLFAGDDDIDQLHRIFAVLGAPHVRIWPEIDAMPVIRKQMINLDRESLRYPFNRLQEVLSGRAAVSSQGLRLIDDLLTYSPTLRCTARQALRHEFFQVHPLPKEIDFMPTFPSQHDNNTSSTNADSYY